MIKAEKGNASIVGGQNEVFLELATIMYAIREKLGDEEAEKFVKNAFFLAGHGLAGINLSTQLIDLFEDKNSDKQGEDQ